MGSLKATPRGRIHTKNLRAIWNYEILLIRFCAIIETDSLATGFHRISFEFLCAYGTHNRPTQDSHYPVISYGALSVSTWPYRMESRDVWEKNSNSYSLFVCYYFRKIKKKIWEFYIYEYLVAILEVCAHTGDIYTLQTRTIFNIAHILQKHDPVWMN